MAKEKTENRSSFVRASVKINSSLIKREIIDGEEHIIVPASTLPPDIVMNGILVPSGEVKLAFLGLDGTPAPLGHPKVDGKFVSASNVRGTNKYSVGAWNRSPVYTDKVHLEKVINVRVCKASPHGARLLEAIEKEEPISSSVAFFCREIATEGMQDGKQYSSIATGLEFDHDAFLLDEPGAAEPEDGVGIYVNSQRFSVSRENSAEGQHKEHNTKGNEMDPETVTQMLLNAFKLGGNKEKEPEKVEPKVGDGKEQPGQAETQGDGGEKKEVEKSTAQTTQDNEKALDDKVQAAVEKAMQPIVNSLAQIAEGQKDTTGFGLPTGAPRTNSAQQPFSEYQFPE